MPRIARIIAAGHPHHITQRGNNRATVFFDDEDRQTYLKLLLKYSQKYTIAIWAYCLMSNHIHLLAVPETETALARGIGLTNLMYTQYLNRKLNQSGRIWQNRFFSCLVENDQYLWAVARYIERNPVKAGLAARRQEYRWSSAKAHVTGHTIRCCQQIRGCRMRSKARTGILSAWKMRKLITPFAKPPTPDGLLARNRLSTRWNSA